MKALRLIIPLCAVLLGACDSNRPSGKCQALMITDARVHEAPPGVEVLAGYMTLRNPVPEDIYVEKADSAAFDRIEFHRTLQTDGIMTMERMKGLKVAGGDKTILKPGGMHMMLFEPARELRQGDSVSMTLECAGGDSLAVEIPVRRITGKPDKPSHHHH